MKRTVYSSFFCFCFLTLTLLHVALFGSEVRHLYDGEDTSRFYVSVPINLLLGVVNGRRFLRCRPF
jgi:hypothetical protein